MRHTSFTNGIIGRELSEVVVVERTEEKTRESKHFLFGKKNNNNEFEMNSADR